MRGLGRGPRKGEWGAGHSHTGVGLLLGEVTGQAQVGDAHVAMLIQQDIGGLWRKPREQPTGRLRTGPGQAGCQLGRCLLQRRWVFADKAPAPPFTT